MGFFKKYKYFVKLYLMPLLISLLNKSKVFFLLLTPKVWTVVYIGSGMNRSDKNHKCQKCTSLKLTSACREAASTGFSSPGGARRSNIETAEMLRSIGDSGWFEWGTDFHKLTFFAYSITELVLVPNDTLCLMLTYKFKLKVNRAQTTLQKVQGRMNFKNTNM